MGHVRNRHFRAWAADALAVTILELWAAVGRFKRVQKLEDGLRRVRRQLSGGRKEPNRSPTEATRRPRGAQEEAKKRQRGAHEEPRGGQEEPKRNPREGLWSPEAENAGPRARPTKTFA